jgi:PWI domain
MPTNLTGFLTDSTPVFMAVLWNLLIEAQTSPAGILQSFVEEKKVETRRAKEGDTRALTDRDRRQRLDEIRELERSERSDRGSGRRNWKRWSTERQWLEQPWMREQPFLRFQSKENISRPLASTIPPRPSPLVAGRPPAIARLVPATLRIAPAPAAPSA